MKQLRNKQIGAEMVEFLVTFLLFLLVFLMIVDFAIAMYNRGTVTNAARDGSRQASLYWVDPLLFNPLTPDQNQLLKRTMVDSVMAWSENNLLIDPVSAGLNLTLQINGITMTTDTQPISNEDVVSVNLLFPHSYVGLSGLTGIIDPILTANTSLGVE